ncbi:MAG: FKBP-type peptidyl-prolyl cis-trans isomerase [Bacteroidales bacterium]|jgi:FKBP-type peptidyl-prolyl cis-trans isomerase|nr:FKBP-type peptidyl-prolyl cis-trans isomerase [Bacteroidales bacterium]
MGVKKANICAISIIVFLFCFACQNKGEEASVVVPLNVEKEKIAVNREIVRRETTDIELIAKRYHWQLICNESGLYYQIVNTTSGRQPQAKDRVKIKGIITLPDGKEIYNSATDGIKEFVVHQSDEPVGLHELVKLMHEGEKANAVIPSHLGYGISGNGTNIPALSLLICKIELININ